MKEEKFIDNVLLKMRRQYSENEAIATFSKRILDLKVEKGMLLAEIDELKYQLKNVNNINDKIVREHHIVKQYKKLMKNRRNEIKQLKVKIENMQ